MGTGNISTATPGTTIPAQHHNQLKDALSQTHVPRNASGVATDVGGGLGSTLYRWATSYINKIFFGTAAEECSIENSGNNLIFKIGGVEKGRIDANGYDGLLVQAPGLKSRVYQTAGTYSAVVPSDAYRAIIFIIGGGGGGGGGHSAAGSWSGGGGGGTLPYTTQLKLTPGETLSIVCGAGGTGGTGGSEGSGLGGAPGTAGSSSIVTGAGGTITAVGGQAGPAGSTTANAKGDTAWGPLAEVIGGGKGGTTGTAAVAGTASKYAPGGTSGGQVNSAADGGGGGAGFGAGGRGARNLTHSADPGTYGGGGGGGATNGQVNNKNGANGGAGLVVLMIVTKSTTWETVV